MVRKPVSISWIEEIIAYYVSDKPGHKKWFTRKMNQLSEEEQGEVWTALESRGYSRPEDAEESDEDKPSRQIVSWSDDEWDQLAEAVWRSRKNDPAETLIGLVKKVMPAFPEARRRNIRVLNEIKPLIERLQRTDEEMLHKLEEGELAKLRVEELESQHQAVPTREDILGAMTDEEVLQQFGQRVLHLCSPEEILKEYPAETLLANLPISEIAGQAIKSGVESFMDTQRELLDAVRELSATTRQLNTAKSSAQRPSIPTPRPQPSLRLPKVTVVGLLANQQAKVKERLEGRANFNFVDKNRKADAIPADQDVILLAANFISHAMQDAAKKRVQGTNTRLVVHHGGVDMLVRKLDSLLPQEVLS